MGGKKGKKEKKDNLKFNFFTSQLYSTGIPENHARQNEGDLKHEENENLFSRVLFGGEDIDFSIPEEKEEKQKITSYENSQR